MKKQFFALAAALFLSLGAFAQSDNGLIGRARGLAHDCLQDWNPSSYTIGEGVYHGTCIAGGEFSVVYFYALPVLPPCDPEAEPCPVPLPVVIAEVEFDCFGNENVTCY